MSRISYRATASILVLALSLAGCGEDQQEDNPAAPKATAHQAAHVKLTVETAAAQAVVNHYADLVLAVFSDAHHTAQQLQTAIHALLAKPSPETLKAAREAWLTARIPYTQSEVFRFGNPVVDEWESQINAWPLDEGLIDYIGANYQPTLGNPAAKTNIIANTVIQVEDDKLDLKELTADKLASLNQLGGYESNVTTGYHAIEFLLWGESQGNNAGKRPASDFQEGKGCTGGHCERRRAYLKIVADLLVSDLAEITAQWQPDIPDNYRAELVSESPASGLHKMLFGMMRLSTGVLAGERLQVALEDGSTGAAYDGFSDNTSKALSYNERGIRNLYLGEYQKMDGSTLNGPSLSSLTQSVAPALDKALKADLQNTETQIQALVSQTEHGSRFSQLAVASNPAGQTLIRNTINALTKQTTGIEQVARQLGLQELTPEEETEPTDQDNQ